MKPFLRAWPARRRTNKNMTLESSLLPKRSGYPWPNPHRHYSPLTAGIRTLRWLALCALLLPLLARADNPIIAHQGVCDPRIHIFNGRAYLFSTHDDARGHPIYTMYDWQLFSSPDLIHWRKEFVLRPEDTFMGRITDCYATDAAERHGKYYWYFSEGQQCLGVAVSTNGPGGPYRDALGKPLLPKGLTPTAQYDPSVFIDDDPAHTPYLIWGYTVAGQQYHMARLNEDMNSLAEKPRPVTLINGWKNDAPFIMKHNGIYYLNSHGACYATATNVYGPYTFRGVFSHDQTVDHGGFFTWHNQKFFAYGVPDGDPFFRETKIVYAHFKDNGDIADDPFIEQSPLGVGQYDARWEAIQAEWFFAASDGIRKRENATGFDVQNLAGGSWLEYPNVRHLNRDATLTFRIASANPNGGFIEVREQTKNGALLGRCKIPDTGSWTNYQLVTSRLKNRAGTNDLCLVFQGGGGALARLDWFKTDCSVVTAKYEAEDARLLGGCATNTNHVGYSGAGFVDGFYQNAGAGICFTITNAPTGNWPVTLRYSAGAGGQSLGVYVNGRKIRDTALPATTDWDTWADKVEDLPLQAGTDTILFKTETGVPVNLDYIAAPVAGKMRQP